MTIALVLGSERLQLAVWDEEWVRPSTITSAIPAAAWFDGQVALDVAAFQLFAKTGAGMCEDLLAALNGQRTLEETCPAGPAVLFTATLDRIARENTTTIGRSGGRITLCIPDAMTAQATQVACDAAAAAGLLVSRVLTATQAVAVATGPSQTPDVRTVCVIDGLAMTICRIQIKDRRCERIGAAYIPELGSGALDTVAQEILAEALARAGLPVEAPRQRQRLKLVARRMRSMLNGNTKMAKADLHIGGRPVTLTLTQAEILERVFHLRDRALQAIRQQLRVPAQRPDVLIYAAHHDFHLLEQILGSECVLTAAPLDAVLRGCLADGPQFVAPDASPEVEEVQRVQPASGLKHGDRLGYVIMAGDGGQPSFDVLFQAGEALPRREERFLRFARAARIEFLRLDGAGRYHTLGQVNFDAFSRLNRPVRVQFALSSELVLSVDGFDEPTNTTAHASVRVHKPSAPTGRPERLRLAAAALSLVQAAPEFLNAKWI